MSNRKHATASADDPKLVANIMRAKKGTRAFDDRQALLNTASRAGAGGVIPGQVGLRPQGLKKANDLIDYFTPGKLAKKVRPFEKEVETPKNFKPEELPFKMRLVLPRTFCPDCDRMDRPQEGGAINILMMPEDRTDLGLKAMEIAVSFFCQECCTKYQAAIKDPGGDIELATIQGIRSSRQQWMAERLVKVKANTEGYIRANKHREELWCNGGVG